MASQNTNPSGLQHYLDLARREIDTRNQALQTIVKNCRFDTISVHGLYTVEEALEKNQGAIIEPVYLSSSQGYRDSNEMEAALSYQIPTWCYSRIANPSVYYYEWMLAMLEGYGTGLETSCCATSSGMSAIATAVLPFVSVRQGESSSTPQNFVATAQCYGGSFQLFTIRLAQERGIECRWVKDGSNLEEWAAKIDSNTRFVYGELPSNPQLGFFDIKEVADLAHQHGVPLICDSTIASPALLRPLGHGADIVVQSVTKSLSSSGFGICGAVISKKNITAERVDDSLREDFALGVKFLQNRDLGPNLNPMQAVLAINDMRTLRSKMDLLSRNTARVAAFLENHSGVEQVSYLGLESHPLHELASRYMWLVDAEHDELYNQPVNRYGHLMSFNVAGGAVAARTFFDRLQRIWRATDLGRIKSVATIPAISTHQQQGDEGRKLAGIPPNMVRLCVGAEHPDDIIADLDQALQKG